MTLRQLAANGEIEGLLLHQCRRFRNFLHRHRVAIHSVQQFIHASHYSLLLFKRWQRDPQVLALRERNIVLSRCSTCIKGIDFIHLPQVIVEIAIDRFPFGVWTYHHSSLVEVALPEIVGNDREFSQGRPDNIHQQIASASPRPLQKPIVRICSDVLRLEVEVNCLVAHIVHLYVRHTRLRKATFGWRAARCDIGNLTQATPNPTPRQFKRHFVQEYLLQLLNLCLIRGNIRSLGLCNTR